MHVDGVLAGHNVRNGGTLLGLLSLRGGHRVRMRRGRLLGWEAKGFRRPDLQGEALVDVGGMDVGWKMCGREFDITCVEGFLASVPVERCSTPIEVWLAWPRLWVVRANRAGVQYCNE